MKVANVDRLLRKIAAMPGAVRQEIGVAINEGADEITSLQRRFVPIEDGVLLGTIENSYEASRLRATMVAGGQATTRPVRNGADAEYDYAFGQEFGTDKMPANPFFYPGLRLGKKRATSRITRAVNKAARRVAGQ